MKMRENSSAASLPKGISKAQEINLKKNSLTTLDELKDTHLGKPGTSTREEYEKEYFFFKIGAKIRVARNNKGMTQEELAKKTGTTRTYISGIENDLKDIRISTLKKIVEEGLGGKLDIDLNF